MTLNQKNLSHVRRIKYLSLFQFYYGLKELKNDRYYKEV